MSRSRKSKRRLKSLFIMLILTAMLMVSSTYAWFSANKEVALEGINAKVVAAEGLQISLDGESWSSKITINQENLAAAVSNNYRWPEALTPVSTVGETASGNMNMFYGEVSADGSQLTNAGQESDTATTKYIVFDLYFKNSSSQATDDLQLNAGTKVSIATDGQQNTGLENCVRSSIVLYENTALMTADGTTIRAIAAGTPLVSIWEPNYNKHIAEVVRNDPDRIPSDSTDFTTLGLKSVGDGTVTGIDVATDPSNEYLGQQKTIKTDATVGDATNMTAVDGSTQLKLKQNSVMKARIYIWLEGQDPDCIDTASTGKSIDIVLGFTKPAVTDP